MLFWRISNWFAHPFRTKSKLFVIEGSDGSGKATHVKELQAWLEVHGYEVAVFSFPQYGQPSAKLVEMYLNREFGDSVNALDPHQASVCYAIDRQMITPAIKAALADGKIVLCDRYQASNKAHQGAKIAALRERLRFYHWLDRLEFGLLGTVRPNQTFVLRVPPSIAQKLAGQKPVAAHLKNNRGDLHEKDLDHLTTASDCYLELCSLYPRDFTLINCTDSSGQLQDIQTINLKLQERIKPLL